jgi:hypothetical protein
MIEWLNPNRNIFKPSYRRKEHEKNSRSGTGAIRSTFIVCGDERVSAVFRYKRRYNRCYKHELRSNDMRSVHELQDLNELQRSVRRHVSDCDFDREFDHTLSGSRMLRRDLCLSGAIQFCSSGSTHLGPIPQPIYLSSLSEDRSRAN